MTEKKLKYIMNQNTQFVNNDIEYNYDIESELTRPKCDTFIFNNITYTCNRKQSVDTSNYMPNPSHVSSGFNNLENYSLSKFGESSRLDNILLRDIDNDRIYLPLQNPNTNQKKYTLPEDTRHLNKKYFL